MIERLGLAALRQLDPERAHSLALFGLRKGLVPLGGQVTSTRLRTTFCGLDIPNPVGLAAGFDKNGEAITPLMRSGFGFIEVGAATPRPQPGNPKPRLFRLSEDNAVINRFGFNNQGVDAIAKRLGDKPQGPPVGLNLGANKDSSDKAADFALVLQKAGANIDFATVNVSSPNTEKLRDLQGQKALASLLAQVMAVRDDLQHKIPIFLKIAPDLNSDEIQELTGTAIEAGIDAIIATNTTLSRQGLQSKHATEMGGLSGQPLFELSTRILAQVCKAADGKLPVIGVGGIDSSDTALEKIRAGASAVQLYSAMVYKGLSLAPKIARGIDAECARLKLDNVSELVGTQTDRWL